MFIVCLIVIIAAVVLQFVNMIFAKDITKSIITVIDVISAFLVIYGIFLFVISLRVF